MQQYRSVIESCALFSGEYCVLSEFPRVAREAAFEIVADTQAPYNLVMNSVLAAMSLAVQGKYRVRRIEGLESPCSLAMVAICPSGERKTTIDRRVMRPFVEFEDEQRKEFEAKEMAYRVQRQLWDVKRRTLLKQLDEAVVKGILLEECSASLLKHEQDEPKRPRRFRLLYSDVTPSAFLVGLHEYTRSVALSEDEASRIFSGPISTDLPLIAKGWDGSDLTVDRRNSPSFTIKAPRVTLNLMVQPKAFEQFMARKGEEARGIGLMARWLVCYPTSTQGHRTVSSVSRQRPDESEFFLRIKELLADQVKTGAMESPDSEAVLTLSPEAERMWVEIANQIERAILPGGYFCQAGDYASKVAENVARIAGVFHVFSGDEGLQISVATLRAAAAVAGWYAGEFVRLFAPADPLHQTVRDAELLEGWLLRVFQTRGMILIDKSFALRYGPNSLRVKERLNWAIEHLQLLNRARLVMYGSRRQFIELNAGYFGNRAQSMQGGGQMAPSYG